MLTMYIQLLKNRSQQEKEMIESLSLCARLAGTCKDYKRLVHGHECSLVSTKKALATVHKEWARLETEAEVLCNYLEQDKVPYNPFVVGDQRQQWQYCLRQVQDQLGLLRTSAEIISKLIRNYNITGGAA